MAPTFLALLAQQLRALLRDKGVALLVVGAPGLAGSPLAWAYAALAPISRAVLSTAVSGESLDFLLKVFIMLFRVTAAARFRGRVMAAGYRSRSPLSCRHCRLPTLTWFKLRALTALAAGPPTRHRATEAHV